MAVIGAPFLPIDATSPFEGINISDGSRQRYRGIRLVIFTLGRTRIHKSKAKAFRAPQAVQPEAFQEPEQVSLLRTRLLCEELAPAIGRDDTRYLLAGPVGVSFRARDEVITLRAVVAILRHCLIFRVCGRHHASFSFSRRQQREADEGRRAENNGPAGGGIWF